MKSPQSFDENRILYLNHVYLKGPTKEIFRFWLISRLLNESVIVKEGYVILFLKNYFIDGILLYQDSHTV